LREEEILQPTNLEEPAGEQATDQLSLNNAKVYSAMVIGAGKLIKEWRTELNLSRRKLAHKLGHDGSQVHYWENNKLHISLLDLQQLSHLVGKDLEQALTKLSQQTKSQGTAIEWKGELYTLGRFKDSLQNPYATLDYSKAQQTYYLKLNPMPNVEFHQRDKITTLLQKNGVQAITELTAEKGTRANIKKADIENIGIKARDRVKIHILNVRRPEDPPWKHDIQVTPTTTSGETRIQLTKLQELGLKAREGDYARITIRTDEGEAIATGQIENGAIRLNNDTREKLQAKGIQGAQTLTARTNSLVLSTEPFIERIRPPPKPREKTTFKLGTKEITIQHQNQTYKITTIEAERIGDLHLYRYKTKQGEEILHIPTENKTIPPHETPWYALPPTTTIYLDKNYKHQLLEAAINKAAGKTQLRHELEQRGTQLCIKYLNDQLHDRLDGMRADKVIPILRYLGKDLDEPNKYIAAIGDRRAIKNPKLPFNLNTLDGTRIIAARYSDGSTHTPKHAGPRFEYTNKDAEQRNRIAESLRNVFGEANIIDRVYDDGRIPRLRATTDIVGHTLQRSGTITGRIILQNPDIPAFIWNGTLEMKREWLIQAFGDEGSPSQHSGTIILHRAIDGTHRLSVEQRHLLDVMSELWKMRKRKADLRKKGVRYCLFNDLPQDIQETLDHMPPRLLESEARMLRDDFGISLGKRPREVYKRKGGYGVSWILQICSREANRAFYSKIGFPQQRKQEKLKNMVGEMEYKLTTTMDCVDSAGNGIGSSTKKLTEKTRDEILRKEDKLS
jgi:transcriptional regulator with XRE-family HTH domain